MRWTRARTSCTVACTPASDHGRRRSTGSNPSAGVSERKPEELSQIHRLADGFTCEPLDGDAGGVHLAVSGELDLANAFALDRTLAAAQLGPQQVTLDLRRLNFMDCCGLAVLASAAARARVSEGRFRVVHASATVDRLFALTGAANLFEITPPGGLIITAVRPQQPLLS